MTDRRKSILLDDLISEFQKDPKFQAAWAVEQAKTSLAVNVFRTREARGYTQEQLADRAGMRQPRIAEIERGDANPRLETIAKIAHALDTSVEELLASPKRRRATTSHTVVARSVTPSLKFTIHMWDELGVPQTERMAAFEAANDNFSLAVA